MIVMKLLATVVLLIGLCLQFGLAANSSSISLPRSSPQATFSLATLSEIRSSSMSIVATTFPENHSLATNVSGTSSSGKNASAVTSPSKSSSEASALGTNSPSTSHLETHSSAVNPTSTTSANGSSTKSISAASSFTTKDSAKSYSEKVSATTILPTTSPSTTIFPQTHPLTTISSSTVHSEILPSEILPSAMSLAATNSSAMSLAPATTLSAMSPAAITFSAMSSAATTLAVSSAVTTSLAISPTTTNSSALSHAVTTPLAMSSAAVTSSAISLTTTNSSAMNPTGTNSSAMSHSATTPSAMSPAATTPSGMSSVATNPLTTISFTTSFSAIGSTTESSPTASPSATTPASFLSKLFEFLQEDWLITLIVLGVGMLLGCLICCPLTLCLLCCVRKKQRRTHSFREIGENEDFRYLRKFSVRQQKYSPENTDTDNITSKDTTFITNTEKTTEKFLATNKVEQSKTDVVIAVTTDGKGDNSKKNSEELQKVTPSLEVSSNLTKQSAPNKTSQKSLKVVRDQPLSTVNETLIPEVEPVISDVKNEQTAEKTAASPVSSDSTKGKEQSAPRKPSRKSRKVVHDQPSTTNISEKVIELHTKETLIPEVEPVISNDKNEQTAKKTAASPVSSGTTKGNDQSSTTADVTPLELSPKISKQSDPNEVSKKSHKVVHDQPPSTANVSQKAIELHTKESLITEVEPVISDDRNKQTIEKTAASPVSLGTTKSKGLSSTTTDVTTLLAKDDGKNITSDASANKKEAKEHQDAHKQENMSERTSKKSMESGKGSDQRAGSLDHHPEESKGFFDMEDIDTLLQQITTL